MRYAYMVAKNTATINDGAVTLTFRPIVTAVEITVINKSRDIKDGEDGLTDLEISLFHPTNKLHLVSFLVVGEVKLI